MTNTGVSYSVSKATTKAIAAHGPRSLWRLDWGATLQGGGARFRVWAPKAKTLDVVLEGGGTPPVALQREANGTFSGFVDAVRAGQRYRYRINGEQTVADPCSRFQPEGINGPSQFIDPYAFPWSDARWPGVTMKGQVLYELHVGCFTPEGTYAAAAKQLRALKDVGVTVIELMPVAQGPGKRGWGYDGVFLFAPDRAYGTPDDLRAFVDQAHNLGLAVILDVVYNHLGPDGCVLNTLSDDYFSRTHKTEWGKAVNYDGKNSGPVRDFFLSNAAYWISEFHLDGLRLDATQSIFDDGPKHVLAEVSEFARAVAAPRKIILVAENEPQDVRCLRPVAEGGFGLDAMWNDDFHHTAKVAMTGFREAYYVDYMGSPQELVTCLKRGFLYQGQHYSWQKQNRGTAVTREAASSLVLYTQNHDQVANQLKGDRILAQTDLALYRAITTLMLTAPATPMLFMGQEFAASSPFLYFTDHKDGLAKLVNKGRKEFLGQFPSIASRKGEIPDPNAEETFLRSKLNHRERDKNKAVVAFHRDLLHLRRTDTVFAAQDRTRLDGAVLGHGALVVRYFGVDHDDRLLVVNVGEKLRFDPCPEPLVAPPARRAWKLLFSSDATRYGGHNRAAPFGSNSLEVPGQSAWIFRPSMAR